MCILSHQICWTLFIYGYLQHRWRVGIMTEMAPEGYVGVSPVCILGFNKVWPLIIITYKKMKMLFLPVNMFPENWDVKTSKGTPALIYQHRPEQRSPCTYIYHFDLMLQNQGEEISLRLRTDDLKGFRKYQSIKKTLLHELVSFFFLKRKTLFCYPLVWSYAVISECWAIH